MNWQGPFIAVDWGTTNRRAWRVAPDGTVEDAYEDAGGVTAIPSGGFPAEIDFLRASLGDLPMLLGGMIGSNRGWRETAYVPCPAGRADLAAAILWIDPHTGIIPGVSESRPEAPDVMRGEEVQIIGALASGAVPADALVCLPGTHAKWARVTGGRIAGFTTWMTGELFAILGSHSILAPQLEGTARAGLDFAAGVAAALEGDALSRLFRVRAAAALGAPLADATSFVSGLLIGGEVRAALSELQGAELQGAVPHLVGRTDLCALYAAAIAQVCGDEANRATVIDGAEAFRAGLRALIGEIA